LHDLDFNLFQKLRAIGVSMAKVIVTGTSKGIGLATALVLARAGHMVFATMRNPAHSPELAATAAKESLPIHISAMDVNSDESVSSGIASILNSAGGVDVLVNNAGIARSGSTEELPLEDFKAVMETNYFGAIRCAKAVIPGMRERRSGLIVNVTSVAGRVSTSPLGPYAASKFALEGLSEALAQEMKTFGVRVAIVEPGIIDTPMAHEIEEPLPASQYPQQARMAAYFAAALKMPTPASLVGEKILEIVESGTWQLRHPVGPGALPLLESRKATSDEDFVAFNGMADDDAWYAAMEQRTGMVLRLKG
jgi:NAD(P)-dependent dehydrogenase (short-subunit alcohol dehydrogenase family)